MSALSSHRPDSGSPAPAGALRLNKAIARAGLASRRAAEALVRDGRVRLNGEIVRDLGIFVDPAADVLEVDGRPVTLEAAAPEREVWALYKPKRVVSTMDDPQGRPCLADWVPHSAGRLFPIGRLDYDAEGLILLTNDGALAQRVAHPRHGVEKTYLVKVKGIVPVAVLRRLGKGPFIDGERRQPVKARVLHTVNDKTWLEVTLREGLQHHIRKMFAAEGHRVLKIKRYRIGGVELAEMEPGQARKLGKAEIATLFEPSGRPVRQGARAPRGA